MTDHSLYVLIAALLINCSPAFFGRLANNYRPTHPERNHLAVLCALVAVDVGLFGLPPVSAPTALLLSVGVSAGAGYYLIEARRLGIPISAMARMRSVSPTAATATLAGSAVLEELVFRWYTVEIGRESMFGAVPAVAISTLFFGLVHQQFGLEAALSRMVAGLPLAIAVAVDPANLWAAIAAHVVYNVLVNLRPAQRFNIAPAESP